jgi:methionyl-tRNA formyltransferase
LPSSCAKRPDRAFLRLAFAGTPEFAARALAALDQAGHQLVLVLTQPDRPGGRGMRSQASAVKRYAEQRGLPLFQPSSVKSEEALEPIRAAQPEALIVAAYGLILPAPMLALAPYGALNIHASLLPRWRGAAPIQRAILAGDKETGISIMQMDAGLDTGPVFVRAPLPILDDDDAGALHERLAALGARLMVETLEGLTAGRVAAQPQPETGATYARKIGKEEAFLDWSLAATDLERSVRAFRPAPGAAARLEGETIKLWRARVREGKGKARAARAKCLRRRTRASWSPAVRKRWRCSNCSARAGAGCLRRISCGAALSRPARASGEAHSRAGTRAARRNEDGGARSGWPQLGGAIRWNRRGRQRNAACRAA